MSEFYKVVVQLKEDSNIGTEELEYLAMNRFYSSGVNAFSINEAEVDEILGTRSYCGGDIDNELIDELESTLAKRESQDIEVYFEGDSAKECTNNFKSFLQENGLVFFSLKDDSHRDWNEEWRKQYQKIEVHKELSIVPSWEQRSSKSNDLLIYPGMGFGTGSHETTYLCLKLFIQKVLPEKKSGNVFDFGCGSGILGLATLLKGWKEELVLYDIDENALTNAKQNIEINGMENENFIISKSLSPFLERTYDLVFANILEGILREEVEHIYQLTATKGFIILSGLLNEQVSGVLDLYRQYGLGLISHESKGDWSAILLKKQ